MRHPMVPGILLLTACVPPSAHDLTYRKTPCAGGVAVDTAVYSAVDLSARPALRRFAPVRVPLSVLTQGDSLRVLVLFILGTDGTPERRSIKVVNPTETSFDSTAVEATARMLFWPGCRGAHPVRSLVEWPFYFHYAR